MRSPYWSPSTSGSRTAEMFTRLPALEVSSTEVGGGSRVDDGGGHLVTGHPGAPADHGARAVVEADRQPGRHRDPRREGVDRVLTGDRRSERSWPRRSGDRRWRRVRRRRDGPDPARRCAHRVAGDDPGGRGHVARRPTLEVLRHGGSDRGVQFDGRGGRDLAQRDPGPRRGCDSRVPAYRTGPGVRPWRGEEQARGDDAGSGHDEAGAHPVKVARDSWPTGA